VIDTKASDKPMREILIATPAAVAAREVISLIDSLIWKSGHASTLFGL
jgi:hypothetical protein